MVGRVLSDMQISDFAERGYIVASRVVPGDIVDKAAQRIDDIAAAGPPGQDKRGAHFYFRETKDEPALIAPLTSSPAFSLGEELAGRSTLEVPWQVQVALNIAPYSHCPGRPHIDAANAEPAEGPVRGTFTMLAGILMTDQLSENCGNLWVYYGSEQTRRALYFRISTINHASHRDEFLQDTWLDYAPIRTRSATA